MEDKQDKQELFTIQDIIRLTRISQNTLYRYIRQGKIKTIKMIKSGKQVITIEKQELERFLGYPVKGDTTNDSIDTTTGKQDTTNDSIDTTTGKQDTISGSIYDKTLTKSDIKELFQELIQEQNTLIMKPMEEQSLYRLGRVEQENSFLKAKVETLLQELEQYKSLPGPADVEKWQKEKEDLLYRAETIQKDQDSRHKVELEKQKKDIEEAHRQELEQIKSQAEEEKKQIAETWRKELEEARRPWWKFW